MRPEADRPFTSTLYKWVRPGAPQGRTKGKPQGQLTMIRIIGISYPKMWQLQRLRFFILTSMHTINHLYAHVMHLMVKAKGKPQGQLPVIKIMGIS